MIDLPLELITVSANRIPPILAGRNRFEVEEQENKLLEEYFQKPSKERDELEKEELHSESRLILHKQYAILGLRGSM